MLLGALGGGVEGSPAALFRGEGVDGLLGGLDLLLCGGHACLCSGSCGVVFTFGRVEDRLLVGCGFAQLVPLVSRRGLRGGGAPCGLCCSGGCAGGVDGGGVFCEFLGESPSGGGELARLVESALQSRQFGLRLSEFCVCGRADCFRVCGLVDGGQVAVDGAQVLVGASGGGLFFRSQQLRFRGSEFGAGGRLADLGLLGGRGAD